MLIGISLNQAGVYRKAFTADKASPNTRRDNAFKHVTKNIVIAETLIPKRQLIRSPRRHEPAGFRDIYSVTISRFSHLRVQSVPRAFAARERGDRPAHSFWVAIGDPYRFGID
jgi:hypothetical protein